MRRRIVYQAQAFNDWTSAQTVVNTPATRDANGNFVSAGFTPGSQSQILVVTVTYNYPFFTPWIGGLRSRRQQQVRPADVDRGLPERAVLMRTPGVLRFTSRLRRALSVLLRDRRATVAIEFGFAMPIMCMMTFGLYEVTQGVICYMKVVDVAHTVADLVAQAPNTGIGNTEFDNYYIAGQLVMTPSSGTNLGFAIANVYYDSNGANPTVGWQIQRGGAAAITNATSFVSGLGTANGSTIIVQASYTYSSLLNYFITSPIVITSEVTEQPRYALPPANTKGVPCPPTNGSETCS